MADLFDRLFPADPVTTTDKIPVHPFTAALFDYVSGNTTRTQMVNAFNLDAEAQSDLDAIKDTVDAASGLDQKLKWMLEFDSTMILAEAGLKYTTRAAFATRLGIGS